MSRSSFWSLWIAGAGGLGLTLWMAAWMQGIVGTQNLRPHATLYLQIWIGAAWVIIWALVFRVAYAGERRGYRWKQGAQARREAAIHAQATRMAEVNKLVDTYGMDIGIIAYVLDEDPGEVERVLG